MNCKQGDLAVVIKGNHRDGGKYIGTVVTCVAPSLCSGPSGAKSPGWRVDPPIGGIYRKIADIGLKPIRDQPGADETLSWKPVPTSEPVNV